MWVGAFNFPPLHLPSSATTLFLSSHILPIKPHAWGLGYDSLILFMASYCVCSPEYTYTQTPLLCGPWQTKDGAKKTAIFIVSKHQPCRLSRSLQWLSLIANRQQATDKDFTAPLSPPEDLRSVDWLGSKNSRPKGPSQTSELLA